MTAAIQEASAAEILLADTLDPEALYSLDTLSCRQDDWRSGIESALPKLSSKSDPEVRLAAAHMALGNVQEALRHAEKVPNNAICAMIIGLAREKEGKNEEALKSFQKAAQGAPTIAPYALKPIDSLRRLGRLDEAMAMAENQKKQFSDKPELDFYIGRVLEDSGRYQEALDHYRRSIDIDPNTKEIKGGFFKEVGDYAASLKTNIMENTA